MQATAWDSISKAVNTNASECSKLWDSLKRSARYNAHIPRTPSKSGASADDMEIEIIGKIFSKIFPLCFILLFLFLQFI